MTIRDYFYLSIRAIHSFLTGRGRPLVGTVILGDRCNLTCAHCGVGNVRKSLASYPQVKLDLETLWNTGVRLLFFCGGETFLWEDEGKNLRDLVLEAKAMGFYAVNVVTNGTLGLDLPEADLVLLSLDGIGPAHDRIRGEGVYDTVIGNLDRMSRSNVCLYAAINAWNLDQIQPLGELARNHPSIRCISFNFHTPYPGTEHLVLSPEQRIEATDAVRALIQNGYPVFNLESGLDKWLKGTWKRPCTQCIVIEEGVVSTCGRCVDHPGLCEVCGYLFAVEFTLIFQGHLPTLVQMFRTYPRYV